MLRSLGLGLGLETFAKFLRVSVSKNLVSEKSLGFGFEKKSRFRKIWSRKKKSWFRFRKKSRFRFRKIWSRKKSIGFGFGKIWPWKKVSVSVSVKILVSSFSAPIIETFYLNLLIFNLIVDPS